MVNIRKIRSLGALLAPTFRLRPFGPALGLFDNILRVHKPRDHATKISFDDDDDDFALIKQRLRGAAPGGERKSRPRETRDPLHTRFL